MVKQLLVLNQSISPSERFQAAQLALSTFNHDHVEIHDYEMSLGADKVLCLKIGYAVVTNNKSDRLSVSFCDEIGMLCHCLTQIYKCNLESRLRSFRHLGATEILPLLVQIWTDIYSSQAMKANQNRQSNSDGGDSQNVAIARLALSVIQLLRVYSKLTPAKPVLLRYNNYTFIGTMLKTVLRWLESDESSSVFWEVLGFVKDLTCRVAPADKQGILHIEGAIMLKIWHNCCSRTNELHPRIQEWFTAVVWNMVLDPSSCEVLFLGVGGDERGSVVEGLIKTLMFHSTNSKKSGLSTKIKRNAISALGNIAADPYNHTFLFRNPRITNSLTLLPRFINLVNDDPDSVVRRRAMRTMRCLASSQDAKTKAAVQNENLPPFLVEVIARNVSHDDENDHDMQIQACQTAIVLIDDWTPEDRTNMEKALARRIETTTITKLISACSQCLVDCLKTRPSAHVPDVYFTEMFWTRLENAVSVSSECHVPVSRLLLEMIKRENLNKAAEGSASEQIPSTLTIPPVINTLTVMLSEPDSSREESRNNALDTVILLVENENNKRPLAENEGLLSGLVNMCLMQPGPSNKTAAKRVILELVPAI
jgi:hypothetical protein